MKRRILAAIIVAAMLVLALPATGLAAGSDATVSGVVSGASGPLGAAAVKVEYLAKDGSVKRTDTLTTAENGVWSYAGKAGDYRLTFSADGHYTSTQSLRMVAKGAYVVDVALVPVPPPSAVITGTITGGSGSGMSGYVYFYKQNADSTWPASYLSQVATAGDGTYSSGPLPLGTYKVRLFTVHTGVQWYLNASTMASATPIVLDTDGQVVSGIDAHFQ